jgi:predicted nucleic-acid-binding Zn-ribbon protein
MKSTNTCPKCQSTEIVRIPGQTGPSDTYNFIPISGGWIPTSVSVTRFLCADCGFSEEWVEGEDDLKKAKDRYRQYSKSLK